MKRRALSLALILCLLLSFLAAVPLSSAEEPAQTEVAAIEPLADVPGEEPAQPEPETLEPPAEAAPEDEIADEIAEQPEAELPAEDGEASELAGDETSPEEQIPAEEAPAEDVPAESPEVEEVSLEMGAPDAEYDPFAEPALGSDGVQYAGVAYLSEAAYASMSEEQQANYVEMVDGLTDLLDAGVPVYSPVFSLNAEGELAFDFALDLQTYAEDLAPEAEVVKETEPEAEATEEAEAVEIAEADEAQEAEAEPSGPIVENVELAERVRVPVRRIDGWLPQQSGAATIDSFDLAQFNTLYYDGEDFYYPQLDAIRKQYYDAAKEAMVEGGKNGFTVKGVEYAPVYAADALSALMLSYPEMFDWVAMVNPNPPESGNTGSLHMAYASLSDGKYNVEVSLDISPYYSVTLERNARAKVAELVEDALADAQANYPNDLDYGMVRYFDDWICKKNYYNKSGTLSDYDSRNSELYYYCHTCYGILLKKYGVCESYALAMSRLLDAAGIPNLYMVGTAGEGHAWNYVHMSDGKYYLQDTTWNDPSGEEEAPSLRTYLLSANDSRHKPTGKRFVIDDSKSDVQSKDFSFPEISGTKYAPKTVAATTTPRITAAPTHPVFATPKPTQKVTSKPSGTATTSPTRTATTSPTGTATTSPTGTATTSPTGTATTSPTGTATTSPTGTATIKPTVTPTIKPTATAKPTVKPTVKPTIKPTVKPTATVRPTERPTVEPTPQLLPEKLYLAKGSTYKLAVVDPAYAFAKQSWKSSAESVATVNKNGKVTAKKAGKAIILLDAGGVPATCEVLVYQFKGLSFAQNGKASLSDKASFLNWDGSETTHEYEIRVNQSNPQLTAEAICADSKEAKALSEPTYSLGKNPSVAAAEVELSGDTITLTVHPKAAGETNIKVSFGGQSATLKLKVRRTLEEDWFALAQESREYTGSAIKPVVLTTGAAAAGLTLKKNRDYSVSYKYNKAASEGAEEVANRPVAIITGKGNYYGEIKLEFAIEPKSIADATVSQPAAKTYNGQPQAAGVTVKLGKKKLKAGVDYDVFYTDSEGNPLPNEPTGPVKPTNAGSYTLTIRGKGNYTWYPSQFTGGDKSRVFEIKPVSLGKLTLKLANVNSKSKISYTGQPMDAAALGLQLKSGKKLLLASDYADAITYKYPDGSEKSDPPTERGKYTLILTPHQPGNITPTTKKPTLTKTFTIS